MKTLATIFLLISFNSFSQRVSEYTVVHGDTVYLIRHTMNTQLDSALRYNVNVIVQQDTTIYDTSYYMFKYSRILSITKDSVKMNNHSYQQPLQSGVNVKTINNQPIVGSGDLPISGSGVTRVFLPGDVANSNVVANTIADVTGLSFPVNANTTYKFRFFIVYSSAATTTGSRWCINGPVATFLNYYSNYTLSATAITNNQGLSTYNVPAASSASSLTSNNIAIIEGIIRPSASGNVIARFASEVSSSAITAVASGRSYVEYEIIN